jgi:hypothetical protein
MKLSNIIIAMGILAGSAQAATVVVANGLAGTNVQGISFVKDGATLATGTYFLGVGTFSGGVFTTWDGLAAASSTSVALDTNTGSPPSEATGSFTTTAAAATNLDGTLIYLFVGTGNSIATSGTSWAVFSVAGTNFPVASGAASQTFSFSTPASITVVAKGLAEAGFSGTTSTVSGSAGNFYNFNQVPEPSAALLGAIGALGLLRRRRN